VKIEDITKANSLIDRLGTVQDLKSDLIETFQMLSSYPNVNNHNIYNVIHNMGLSKDVINFLESEIAKIEKEIEEL